MPPPPAPFPAARDQPPAFWRLLPLYVVIFAGFVGYSLMITIFTPLVLQPGGWDVLPAGVSGGARSIVLGGLLALYPLGQFVSSPVLGGLSDRYGRRRVLVLSLATTTACYAAVVASLLLGSLALLAVACLVAGLAEANVVIAQGAISDLTPPEQRERFFGYVYLSASLAYIVGPLVGGKLADPSVLPWFGPAVPFVAVCLLLAGITATVAWRFAETRAPSATPPATPYAAPPAVGAPASLPVSPFAAFAIVGRPGLRRLFGTNFLIYLATFGFFRAYPMYLAQAFHLGVSRISEFVAWVGLPIVLVNLGVTGLLAARVTPRRLAIATAAASGAAIALIVLPAGTLGLWPLLFLAGALVAVLLPTSATLLSTAASADEQGAAMGGNQALQVGAEALSGVLSGLLAAVSVRLPLPALGACAVAAALLIAWRGAARPAGASS